MATKTATKRNARTRRAAKSATLTALNGGETKRFDLGTRRAKGTVDIPIYDPADLSKMIDTGIRIRMASVWSKEAQDAAARAAEGKDIRIEGGKVVASEAVIDDNVFEQTIGATLAWFHVDLTKPKLADGSYPVEEGWADGIQIDGEKIPCTPETVRQLYSNPDTRWIQKQVEPWYLNVGNFFGGPKSQSPSLLASASA